MTLSASACSTVKPRCSAALRPPPVKLTPEQKLGLPRAKVEAMEAPPNAPAQITNFTAAIQSVTVERPGHQVYTLDNGQVWREDQTGNIFGSPRRTIRIRKGALGSFFLESQTNSHLSIRVDACDSASGDG